jgi:hypothetical protein
MSSKAQIHFAQFMYGLKPAPFKLTRYQEWRGL